MMDPKLASTVQAVVAIEDVGLPGHTPINVSLRVGMTRQPMVEKKSLRPLDLPPQGEEPYELPHPLIEALRLEWD